MSVTPLLSSPSLLIAGGESGICGEYASPLMAQAPLESTEKEVNKVVDKWAEIAKGLPEDQYHTCMGSVKRLARELLKQIDDFSKTGATKAELQQHTQRIIQQLELSAEKFCQTHKTYRNEQEGVRRQFALIDQTLSTRSLPAPLPFTNPQLSLSISNQVQQRLMAHPLAKENKSGQLAIMSGWSIPSSREKKKPKPNDHLRAVLRNEEESDRREVEIVAKLLEKKNEAIVWGAKKVCGLHPQIDNICTQGKELVVKGAQIVDEHMPDIVKETASKLSQMRKEAIQVSLLHDEKLLGIPVEETLKFHDNLATIGLESLNFVGGTAAGTALARLSKSTLAATKLVVSKIPTPTPKTIPLHLQTNLAETLLQSRKEYLLKGIPFSEQTFEELAHKANPRIPTEHTTFYKKGEDFVVRVGKGEHSVVIKGGVDTHDALFEAFGSQFYHTLKLKNLRFTPPLHILQNNGRVILVKPYAPGRTIESSIHQYMQKKIPLEEVREAIGQLGKAYDELQRVATRYGISPSPHQKSFAFHPDSLLESLHEANLGLQAFDKPRIALTEGQIATFSKGWQQSEVLAGFQLGDVGLSNFVSSKKGHAIVYVDGQSLAHGVNRMGQPLGMIENDISMLVTDLFDVSISHGMSAKDAHDLVAHFLNQLHKPVHPLPILTGKIRAVEEILEGIPLGQKPDLQEVGKLVERINEYIQIMQW